MSIRRMAHAILYLYPRPWRERYGAEVRDLLATRPVRLRTLADLCAGAIDTWAHRNLIPGRVRRRILSPLVLTACGLALLWLWNPGIRDVAPLVVLGAPGSSASFLIAMSASAACSVLVAATVATALLRHRHAPGGQTRPFEAVRS